MPHIKVGTIVAIKNYAVTFNGHLGMILARDGEYYTVNLGWITLYGIYPCEMEIRLD